MPISEVSKTKRWNDIKVRFVKEVLEYVSDLFKFNHSFEEHRGSNAKLNRSSISKKNSITIDNSNCIGVIIFQRKTPKSQLICAPLPKKGTDLIVVQPMPVKPSSSVRNLET